MKVLIKQYIINDNFRGLGHPRGPKRTRKTLLKRWDLAKILRTGSRHVYVNIYIYIYIYIYIFIYIHIYIYYINWLLGFPGGSDGKESACNVGDLGLTPGLERSPQKGTATHSRIPACRIPWTEESSRLQSLEW